MSGRMLTDEEAEVQFERDMAEAEANAIADKRGEPIPFPGKERIEREREQREDPRDDIPQWLDLDAPPVSDDDERGFTVLGQRVIVPPTTVMHSRKFSKLMSRERRFEGLLAQVRNQMLESPFDMSDEDYAALEDRLEALSERLSQNSLEVVYLVAPSFPRERWGEVDDERRRKIVEYAIQCLYADMGVRRGGAAQEGGTDPNSSAATSEANDAG